MTLIFSLFKNMIKINKLHQGKKNRVKKVIFTISLDMTYVYWLECLVHHHMRGLESVGLTEKEFAIVHHHMRGLEMCQSPPKSAYAVHHHMRGLENC